MTMIIRGLVLTSLLAMVGCGGEVAKGAKVYNGPAGTVTGKITYKGQPIPANCAVVFDSGQEYIALGVVGANGTYTVQFQKSPKIPVYVYKVQLSPPPPPTSTAPPDPNNMPEQPKPPFPEKYTSLQTTTLTADVKEGANTLDLVLTD